MIVAQAGSCGAAPEAGRVLVQREVRPALMIIGQELSERASKGPLIPRDGVIEALPPQGPDQAILPGAWRRYDILGPETVQGPSEVWSVDAVAISQQIKPARCDAERLRGSTAARQSHATVQRTNRPVKRLIFARPGPVPL